LQLLLGGGGIAGMVRCHGRLLLAKLRLPVIEVLWALLWLVCMMMIMRLHFRVHVKPLLRRVLLLSQLVRLRMARVH
jgi:hypothetical protein